jgi:lipopolysaccharide/colanic/teichoic acid biosynthesis glycosyltransferase
MILLLLPFFLFIIVLLRLTGEGEVFYRQERVGYKNRVFFIWKFATMVKNSPNIGTKDLSLKDDERILPVGKFIRKYKINELPQLFNIFTGEMSLVGPRPLMPVGFIEYESSVQRKIYLKKPGLTGIGSIVFRDEDEIIANSGMNPREAYKKLVIPFKGKLEIWYLENQSLIVDLKIITLTAIVILFPRTNLAHKLFPNLPKRPTTSLAQYLNNQ